MLVFWVLISYIYSGSSFMISAIFYPIGVFPYSCYSPMNNYMIFNDSQGIYTYTFEAEKKVWLFFKETFVLLINMS